MSHITKDGAWVVLPARGYVLTTLLSQYLDRTDLRGAEIGVLEGKLSRYLLDTHKRLFLYMVDRWEGFDPDSAIAQSGDLLLQYTPLQWGRAYQLAMDHTDIYRDRRRVIRSDSVAAADKIDDESLDFVFIDADHSFEGALRDLRAWIPKVKPDGLIAGHDFETPGFPKWGVRQALESLGVKRISLGYSTTWGFPKAWL